MPVLEMVRCFEFFRFPQSLPDEASKADVFYPQTQLLGPADAAIINRGEVFEFQLRAGSN